MANTALNRTGQLILTNKSGGAVAQGDIVVVDTTTAASFTTTTTSGYVGGSIGVILEPNGIANNALGMVAVQGYVPVINLSGTGSIGDMIKTHTVAKQGVRNAAPAETGNFAQALGTSATPVALLWGIPYFGAGAAGAPTTSKYITAAADAGLSAEIVIPGLAGSADVKGSGGAGASREFESGDTAPTWTSAPAASDVGTTVPSHLYALTTDATERFAYYDWSPAGDFDARCSIQIGFTLVSATPDGDFGLCIGNSDNSVRLVIFRRIHNFGGTVHGLYGYSYASSSYTDRGSLASGFNGLNPAYLRIKRVSTTSSFYWSAGGIVWNFIGSTTQAITVAKIGFRFAGGASSEFYGICDWLRTDV